MLPGAAPPRAGLVGLTPEEPADHSNHPVDGEAGKVTVTADPVLIKKPLLAVAVNGEVFTVVQKDKPKPVAVPLLVNVAPQGIVIVSPDSPNWIDVPVLGVILFTFSSLII